VKVVPEALGLLNSGNEKTKSPRPLVDLLGEAIHLWPELLIGWIVGN